MALSSVIAGLKLGGYASDKQTMAMNTSLNGLYEALQKDDTYRPDSFVTALRDFQKTLRSTQPKSGP